MGIAGEWHPERQALNPGAQPWLPCPVPPGLIFDDEDSKNDTVKDATGGFYVQALAESSLDMALPIEDPLTEFAGRVTTAAANAVEALITDVPISVHVLPEPRGWSIIIRVRAEDMALSDSVLSCAQETIRQTTEQSGEACLLAFRTKPLGAKSQGFTTSLVLLGDMSQACWDFLETGQCSRSRHCRWEHPVRKQRLCVVVKQLNEAALTEQVAKKMSGESENGSSGMPCDDEIVSANALAEEDNANVGGLPAKVLLDGDEGVPLFMPPLTNMAWPKKV
mmetsp:Transcript_39016/g.74809  ORF Transcript_39016/g.74809 Transcript_39016/m.74809 type:complete len:279 (+) Transcript_39016:68-904(+)